jgi:hypothetical protein
MNEGIFLRIIFFLLLLIKNVQAAPTFQAAYVHAHCDGGSSEIDFLAARLDYYDPGAGQHYPLNQNLEIKKRQKHLRFRVEGTYVLLEDKDANLTFRLGEIDVNDLEEQREECEAGGFIQSWFYIGILENVNLQFSDLQNEQSKCQYYLKAWFYWGVFDGFTHYRKTHNKRAQIFHENGGAINLFEKDYPSHYESKKECLAD